MTTPVHAQRVLQTGSTFLDPFPQSDVYHLTTIGDDYIGGLFAGLSEQFATDSRISVNPKPIGFSGIMGRSFEKRVEALEAELSGRRIDVAVVMMGYWDMVSLRSSEGRRVRVGSQEWIDEYGRRVDVLMKALRRANTATYWVGLPILAKNSANEAAQSMNDVIRERAYLNGVKYVDIFSGFADERSNFTRYGPDLDGTVRKLRLSNGIGFTRSGNRKLSNFVEQELKRDLVEARANRSVPLLGGPEDQARINPENVAKQLKERSEKRASGAGGGSGKAAAAAPVKSIEQQRDDGAVTLKVRGPGGRIEEETVEIVRPPIPASVVSLMARRQGAAQLGDMLVQQIDGGLTIMSTVTSANGPLRGRQRLAPTQAPYFRLLVKGERLPAKPGRADDIRWLSDDRASGESREDEAAADQPKG